MPDLKHATLLVAVPTTDGPLYTNPNPVVRDLDSADSKWHVLQTQVLQQEQWKHLLIQTHREPLDVGPTMMKPVPAIQIILRTAGYSSAQLTANGITHHFRPHPGALFLTDAHQEPYEYQRSRLSDQPVQTTHFYLTSRLLVQTAAEVAGADASRVSLQEGSCLVDPLLQQVCYSLGEALKQPTTGHSLFAETAAQLVAVHLLRQHCTTPLRVPEWRGKLSANRLQQLHDYITVHLDQPITLDNLASIACLSVYHFSRAFKHTVGMSPNQYVIDQRIKRAQQLLRTRLPVAVVANTVGYASVSHFTRLFARYTGCLPSQYE